MSENKFFLVNEQSEEEIERRESFFNLFRACPIPQSEMLSNMGLFIRRQDLSRILFINELYKISLDVPGVVMEFGVRWGQNLALFESFRGIYEPFNHRRQVIGFDTWGGFPSISALDGSHENVRTGSYGVTGGYKNYLENLLDFHEAEAPISHIRKFQLIEGDATKTLGRYLEDNPQTIISLAYFDLDIYEPTKRCLELVMKHVTQGSVLAFDQLNHPGFPGETIALREVLGLENIRLRRSSVSPAQAYFVVGD